MIPIRDINVPRNVPLITRFLIFVNVLVFLVQLGQGEGIQEFIFTYGLVPARYSYSEIAARFTLAQQVFSFISFMFLHGSLWHLVGNAWFLYIFGDNVEDALGSLTFFVFYVCCGVLSGLFHLVLYPESTIPVIGASGAVAGVMGAYMVRYPRASILTLVPVLFIPFFIEVPAAVFLGLWFLFQFTSAVLFDSQGGGIAWWAHVGGFAAGMVLSKIFTKLPGMITMKEYLERFTRKRRGPRLYRVREYGYKGDDCHGVIHVTPYEAVHGARKIISIPRGTKKKTFVISIPPGVQDGQVIRLAGMGRYLNDGSESDCYLTIRVDR